jgi:KipI family sensor histidine kinase inhibitor
MAMPTPSASEPRLLPLGDAAFTVEFGATLDPALHARVLGLAQALETLRRRGRLAGVVEWVPTFRSLTIHFDPDQTDPDRLARRLLAAARKGSAAPAPGGGWRIPVCFDEDFAPDLADLAAARGLPVGSVVRLLTATEFQVYMLGFLPGFPYLGGLPPALEMPRLATPRRAVPAGSLAVAGGLCAVYPWESPGGWRLLGRTPVPLFDARRAPRPALLAPGDRVSWRAVERAEFQRIAEAVAAGCFDLASLAEAAP